MVVWWECTGGLCGAVVGDGQGLVASHGPRDGGAFMLSRLTKCTRYIYLHGYLYRTSQRDTDTHFPEMFAWGVATSAYQIEVCVYVCWW